MFSVVSQYTDCYRFSIQVVLRRRLVQEPPCILLSSFFSHRLLESGKIKRRIHKPDVLLRWTTFKNIELREYAAKQEIDVKVVFLLPETNHTEKDRPKIQPWQAMWKLWGGSFSKHLNVQRMRGVLLWKGARCIKVSTNLAVSLSSITTLSWRDQKGKEMGHVWDLGQRSWSKDSKSLSHVACAVAELRV